MDVTDSQALLAICVSSAAQNSDRRRAVRNSWFRYLNDDANQRRGPEQVHVRFAVSRGGCQTLQQEQAEYKDMVLLDVPEGYEHLWRKVVTFMKQLQEQAQHCKGPRYAFFMHADDDSLVRLDLLVPLLEVSPTKRFYWGYIWDGSGTRITAPIRNPRNKSYIPYEQYPCNHYPPFASGCGFVLSWDLVEALLAQPLPDYRLLDPPFGIHLCGGDRCVVQPPVVPVHDERVRPYRAIPLFHPDTIVQHYLRPEEMKPFYQQAVQYVRGQQGAGSGQAGAASGPSSPLQHGGVSSPQDAPAQLYAQLVSMGLLRR